jgi:prephenate dehydrogenase
VTDENPHLYYEIQYLNKFSLKTISELSNAIKEIFDLIDSGDEDGFVQLMDQSRSYFSEK